MLIYHLTSSLSYISWFDSLFYFLFTDEVEVEEEEDVVVHYDGKIWGVTKREVDKNIN